MVNVKCRSLNSTRLKIITKLGTSSRQRREKSVDNDGNQVLINIFKILFLKARMEQLSKHKDNRIILHTYKKV